MKDLTYWLRKTPQPSAILADDKRVDVPSVKNGRSWKDLTATVKALEPSKVTALDAQGAVLRVVRLAEEEDDKAPPSPELSDLQHFARLLAEAYDKGSRATQPVIDSAMQFTERQAQRLLKCEAENDRLRSIIHKQHLQIVELTTGPQPAGEDSIMGALVAGALQAEVAKQTAPPPPAAVPKNGAPKK